MAAPTQGAAAVGASHPVAPPPPSSWEMPRNYLALRCQFCLSWTTMPTPFTHSKATTCRFYPLMPWWQGTREAPKGNVCLLCATAARRCLLDAFGAWLRCTRLVAGNARLVACGSVQLSSRVTQHACTRILAVVHVNKIAQVVEATSDPR